MGNGRAKQLLTNVKFKQLVDLKLDNKNYMPARSGTGAICLQELALVLSCLKLSNFKEEACSNELKSFNKCYLAIVKNQGGGLTGNISRNKIPGQDVNKLVKRYCPQQ